MTYGMRLSSLLLLALSPLAGSTQSVSAHADQVPVAIDAQASIREFVMAEAAAERAAQQPGTPRGNTMLSIPNVLIYSPTGSLVYRGNASTIEKTSTVLETMPASVQQMSPIPAAPSLTDMLNLVPSFKSQAANVLHDGHYVVYVVTMKRDVPTATQKSVTALRGRSANLSIDTFILYLQE